MDQKGLKEYFLFNEIDLEANRLGRLSDKQKKKLLDWQYTYRNSNLKVGAFCVGLSLLVTFLGFVLPSIQAGEIIYDGLPVSIGFLLIMGGIGTFFLYKGFMIKVHSPNARVVKVEGPVNILVVQQTTTKGRYYVKNELHVGGKGFQVNAGLADVMMQGEIYAIYYENVDNTILSAEWISKK